MSLLITLGVVAIVVGCVLIICGFTIAPQAKQPGWGALILGIILILIGVLVPYVVNASERNDVDTCTTAADC